MLRGREAPDMRREIVDSDGKNGSRSRGPIRSSKERKFIEDVPRYFAKIARVTSV